MPPKKLEVVHTVANQIKKIREEKHLTQIDLAKLAGISQATLSLLEMGKIKITLEICLSLAEGLGCSLDYLLGRERMTAGSPTDQLLKAFEQMDKLSQGLFVGFAKMHVDAKVV